MRDEQEILGGWTVKFRQWTWEYKFAENKTVRWRDPYNNQNGSGRWYKVGNLINISWTGSTTKESWNCPINPDKQGGWIDASYGIGSFDAVRFEKVEPGALAFDYAVGGTVPILRQGLKPVCWAAGVSMMIGWRKKNPVISITQAIDTMGQPYINLYKKGKPIHQSTFLQEAPDLDGIDFKQHFTSAAGLKHEPLRSYTPKQLYELMLRNGSPLLVEAHWDSNWTHFYVIKRIYGEGGAKTTYVIYHDPNSGEEEMFFFSEFMENLEGAANQTTIQVWHY